ncbi:hypothetical protein [Cupriavidus sp. CuC1]|jgi:hypothetical protein|uniref:hypothetical protein n=1 Tax=Cupriavidus sp. CuC1 TaxID=3373131 RepID=UPI0037D52C16
MTTYRPATISLESHFPRCNRKEGSSPNPADYLCELPEDGSLINRAAIAFIRTIAVPLPADSEEKKVRCHAPHGNR